jgi:hypothetical protein
MARCKNVSGPTGGSGGTPGGNRGDDKPHHFIAVEKGKEKKVLAKKRKASDREAEVARVVAAAVEVAEVGRHCGALQIRCDLTPAQGRAVLQAEQLHGTPPGTIMLGGRLVRIDVREPRHEETEVEGQAEG